MKMYGTLYPTHYKFKYPKAGEDNSLISIRILTHNMIDISFSILETTLISIFLE